MIGMAMANDYPSMAILGAKKAVLGTNPFAYAVPAGKNDPIFLDIASSTVAGGKVRIAQTKNQKVPDTWMVDTDGVPTTDPFLYPHVRLPAALRRSQGLRNRADDRKPRGRVDRHRRDVGSEQLDRRPQGHSHQSRRGVPGLQRRRDRPVGRLQESRRQLIHDIHETPKAKGTDRLYVPGEMEWQNRRAALANGIALPADVMESLRGLAGDLS